MMTVNEAKLWYWRDYSRPYLDREQTKYSKGGNKTPKANVLEQSGRYSPMNIGLNV